MTPEEITEFTHQFETYPVTLKEFKRVMDYYIQEISCNNIGDSVASHQSIKPKVLISCQDSNDDFELIDFDVDGLPGCGCWCDLTLVIRKKKNV